MKIETILNAFEDTVQEVPWWDDREKRQYLAFRDRIIKMDAEKEEEIQFLWRLNGVSNEQIGGLKKDIQELGTALDMVLADLKEQSNEIEEKDKLIRDMAWLAYNDQVIDTGMEKNLIGGDNEYADMEDWIESYIKLEAVDV